MGKCLSISFLPTFLCRAHQQSFSSPFPLPFCKFIMRVYVMGRQKSLRALSMEEEEVLELQRLEAYRLQGLLLCVVEVA